MTNEELTKRYVLLDERVTRHTEQLKTCFTQINEFKTLVETVHKLATTVEVMVREQKDTGKKIDKLTSEFEEIKDKPAKRWDTVITVTITVVITALLTYALTQMGLK